MKKMKCQQSTLCGTVTIRQRDFRWNNTELLLIRRKCSEIDWELPIDCVKDGETYAQAAVRGTFDVTGVPVKLVFKLPDIIVPKTKVHIKMFVAKPIDDSVEPVEQHDNGNNISFFRLSRFPTDITVANHKSINDSLRLIRYLYDKERRDPRGRFGVGEVIRKVASYASNIDDFITIKLELIKSLPFDLRLLFSTRDKKTWKQRTNDFEREVAKVWEELTGKRVYFRDECENSEKRQGIITYRFKLRMPE